MSDAKKKPKADKAGKLTSAVETPPKKQGGKPGGGKKLDKLK
jgi:hypothetical protein